MFLFMALILSEASNTFILELVEDIPKFPRGIILIKDDPYELLIEESGWLNPHDYKHENVIRNYYGAFQEFENNSSHPCEIPLIRLSTLLSAPEIERSFYGIVNFTDMATMSDYLKGRAVQGSTAIPTIDGNLMVVGKGNLRRRGYYHSHPIFRTRRVDISQQLEEICTDPSIPSKKRFSRVKNLLS